MKKLRNSRLKLRAAKVARMEAARIHAPRGLAVIESPRAA
jgi:hypothetical protein